MATDLLTIAGTLIEIGSEEGDKNALATIERTDAAGQATVVVVGLTFDEARQLAPGFLGPVHLVIRSVT